MFDEGVIDFLLIRTFRNLVFSAESLLLLRDNADEIFRKYFSILSTDK